MTAGLGTRLHPFTKGMIKPLLPVCGIPLLQYTLDQLSLAGVNNLAANVHHLANVAQTAIRFLEGGNGIRFSDESQQILGSGGGTRTMSHLFFKNEPFYYINGDELLNIDYRDLAKQHAALRHRQGVQITLACLARGPGSTPYSEILLDERRSLVRRIGEKKANATKFAGVALFDAAALSHLDPFKPYDLTKDVLIPKIQAGRVGYFMVSNELEDTPRSWFDIGSPDLWLKTHTDLIHWMDHRDPPRPWRERLEKNLIRLGRGIYTTKNSGLVNAPASWTGPCFWAPLGAQKTPPVKLGPNAVLYGEMPEKDVFEDGIGYNGHWFSSSV